MGVRVGVARILDKGGKRVKRANFFGPKPTPTHRITWDRLFNVDSSTLAQS